MDPATVKVPGFPADQAAYLQAMITTAVNAAFDKHFGPLQATQQSSPPAPPAKKEEDKKPRPQLQYQATMGDVPESTAEKKSEPQHGSSKPGSDKPDIKRAVSTIPRLCTIPAGRAPVHSLGSSFGFFFGFASFLTFQLGYIRVSEGMEASGQG